MSNVQQNQLDNWPSEVKMALKKRQSSTTSLYNSAKIQYLESIKYKQTQIIWYFRGSNTKKSETRPFQVQKNHIVKYAHMWTNLIAWFDVDFHYAIPKRRLNVCPFNICIYMIKFECNSRETYHTLFQNNYIHSIESRNDRYQSSRIYIRNRLKFEFNDRIELSVDLLNSAHNRSRHNTILLYENSYETPYKSAGRRAYCDEPESIEPGQSHHTDYKYKCISIDKGASGMWKKIINFTYER